MKILTHLEWSKFSADFELASAKEKEKAKFKRMKKGFYLPQKHRIAEILHSAFLRLCGKNNKKITMTGLFKIPI